MGEGDDHGQKDPRRQHHREGFRRDRTEGGEDTGGERERDTGDDAGRAAADAERLGETDDAPESGDEQQGPPDPLGDPRRDAQDVAEREERAVRKEVTVGLVLHLAHGGLAAPLMRGPFQESDRILGQVVLGVSGEPAGGLEKCEKKRYDRGAEQPPP